MKITRNNRLVSLLVCMILIVSSVNAEPLAATARSNAGDIFAMEIGLFDDCEVFKDSPTADHKSAPELSVCQAGLWQPVTVVSAGSRINAAYQDEGVLGNGQNACLFLVEKTDEGSKSTLTWLNGDSKSMISRQGIINSKTVCETGTDYSIIGMSSIGISLQLWEPMF